jgi:hypothetical protein
MGGPCSITSEAVGESSKKLPMPVAAAGAFDSKATRPVPLDSD